MGRKRFGIIGAGGQGFRRAEELAATGEAILVGVASPTLAKTQKLATAFGAERATTDYTEMAGWGLDGLIIASPNDTHYEIAKWGLGAGLDILVEGPLCIELEHALELERTSREKGRLVEVGYNSVYHPLFVEAREALASGEIGRPVVAYATAFWRTPRDSWYYRQDISGGMPLAHLSYTFNRMRYLMGRPVSLMARANQMVQVGAEWVHEETCAVVFTFASGALGSLVASYVGEDGQPDRGILVVGTEGSVQVTFERLIIANRKSVRTIELAPEQPNPRYLQMCAFVKSLNTRQEGKNSIADATIDILVARAIAESARTGRAVSLV